MFVNAKNYIRLICDSDGSNYEVYTLLITKLHIVTNAWEERDAKTEDECSLLFRNLNNHLSGCVESHSEDRNFQKSDCS